MYNIIHGLAPAYLTYIFILNNSVHDHHTRGCTNIHVRKYNLSVGQRTFAYRGGKLWDTIPVHIINSKSVECFKTLFKKHVKKDLYNCDHVELDRPV